MIPLIPTLALAFFSFISSAFIILRIVIPILPPHPLSRRVSPAEFGLPNFRSLSPADKSHIWLACFDLLALAIFIWQTINEYTGGPTDFGNAEDPLSALRLWFAMTVRQTCLLIVASITLLHVRLGRSVSFGAKHWMLWAPTLLLTVTSTALAGVLSGAGMNSLFWGLIGYSSTVAILSSIAFGCLIGTLVIIKRNLAALNDDSEPWPPVRQMEEKSRPSFGTEEIDAIRDGASWITSNASASSRHNSISAWSFSTHHTMAASSNHGHGGRAQSVAHPSVPAKSSFWFGSSTLPTDSVPPVPPLPSRYGPLSPTSASLSDPDPFRRDVPSPLPDHPRGRFDSQTSWLTSTNGSQTTLSAWSYPTSHHEGTIRNASTQDLHAPLTAVSRPVTPAMANAQVLGGYGYAPGSLEAEKGLAALAAPAGTTIDISVYRAIGWLITIWVPLGLSLPYLFTVSQNTSTTIPSILLMMSITLSSPLLALNILLRSPIPIPSGLFDVRGEAPAHVVRGPSPSDTVVPYKWSHEYKRSTSASITVIEGRRSGDVWLANGDAVDGKSKISRAVGMLSPMPKLSVLPPDDDLEDGEFTPPLPIQTEDASLAVIHGTPQSETSAQFGRMTRKPSRTSSHLSGGEESLGFASKIMIAQRHYSALAQTVVVAGSSDGHDVTGANIASATGAAIVQSAGPPSHLRSRSVSSISGPQTPTSGSSFNISPPPSFPLPPTPPSVRAARLASLAHKKSFSSGFSFGPVDDMNEIDALTAGVLPILVPGLKVGSGMKITKGDYSPPGTFSKSKGKELAQKLNEFGEDFSSPQVHSTPARKREPRARKTSARQRKHFSLPSLGLGKDGVHSLATWSAEIKGALEYKVGQYTAVPSNADIGRRNTVIGAESTPNALTHLLAVREEEERPMNSATGLGRAMSTRSLGLRAEVPHGIDTARSSMATLNMMPTSAASTVTLFEFEAGLQESGPQAESTPHNTVSHKHTYRHEHAPPMPSRERITTAAYPSSHRRSSIVYIKSDENESPTNPLTAPTTSAMSSLAQWSSRAVRPLIPKANKLQRKMSNTASSPPDAKSGSPSGGLRPLSLLQERDTNSTSPVAATRPLTLGKRQKSKLTVSVQDENVNPDARSGSKNLKPLKLARSETSKMRGVLRKEEVLPDVVVRPPSTTEHAGFAYTFRD